MSFSLQDLTTPLTSTQVKASIYEVLATVGVDTTTWKPGAVVRTMIAATAIIIAAFSSLTALIARSGFLELSSGAWLTLVAKHVFGVDRREATFASGEVTLTNTSGGTYNLGIDDLVVANSALEKTYRNTSAFSLGPGASVTVPIAADESGSASTSTPGTITTLETTLNGVTVTNATSVVGLDAQSDSSLRIACKEKLGALSPNGPWDAYAYAARNAVRQDGTPIGVTRVRIVKDGFGNVDTYVATATGGVTGTSGDLQTDLGSVDDAIQRNAAPLAVTANTLTATAVPVVVTYAMWIYTRTSKSEAEIEAAVATALQDMLSAEPIGGNVIAPDPGKLFVDTVRTAVGSVDDEIFRVVLTSPAADIELAIGDVPVLSGTPTATINLVAPPDGGF